LRPAKPNQSAVAFVRDPVAALHDNGCAILVARRGCFRPAQMELLDEAERGRHAALLRPADRERFVLGCAIARIVLGRHLSMAPASVPLDRTCSTCGRQHGKARTDIDGQQVQMSVSHSGDFVLVGFHRQARIGVDIETIRCHPGIADMARLALSPRELVEFARLEPRAHAVAFATYWTRKEAIVKATGRGLRTRLAAITVTPPHVQAGVLGSNCEDVEPRTMQLHDLAIAPGYAAAIAVLSDEQQDLRVLDAAPLLRAGAPRPTSL
jgi:4'-phosphopantetheinyl transferase